MSNGSSAGRVTVSIKDSSRVEETRERPPRDNLVRALPPAPFEVRDSEDGLGTLVTRFSVFDDWTEINSSWEGRFMERIAPSAFDKTFAENGHKIKVLFDHGKDPSIGNKILGIPSSLRAEPDGAWAEVPLFDTSYNRDLLPGLRAGGYGASFRFSVVREDFKRNVEPSTTNPEAIPERTVLELRCPEFGPVAFPAYENATAGVRSLTDEYIFASLAEDPEKLAELLARLTGQPDAPSTETPAEATSQPERRVTHYPRQTREDFLKWLNSQSSTL